jgi:2-keto-4-pentenoate hydratase
VSNKPHQTIGQRSDEICNIAEVFVNARLKGKSLQAYPGTVPKDFATAYRIQDEAIKIWPDSIAGWKVAKISDESSIRLGSNRFAGPIFRKSVQLSTPEQEIVFPVFVGGFAAVEAELVLVLGESASPDQLEWTLEEATQLIDKVHFGVEIACNPLATINTFGPTAVVSDFGNNAGLILGAECKNWRKLTSETMKFSVFVEDQLAGEASTPLLPQGPFEALRFLLELNARRGRPLQAGDMISSGAVTGVHEMSPGQSAVIKFADLDVIKCIAKAYD